MAFQRMLLGLCVWSLLGAAGVAAPAAAKPVVTNKTRFRIPFRFDAAALERMQARELRLYVSSDFGRSWELTQSISVETGKFEFQAPGDGEYRFAVKTLDVRNQLHPPGETFETGLVVVVDTAAPQLQLDLRQAAPGKVELAWKAIDPNLDAATLRLEYTQPGVDNWQTVGIVPHGTGQTSWSVPTGGAVAVRGFVADLAGNQGREERQVQILPASNANPAPRKPDPRDPIAQAPAIAPAQPPVADKFVDVPHPFTAPVAPQNYPQITPSPAVVERSPVAITHRMQFTSNPTEARPEITQDRWAAIPDLAAPEEVPEPAKPVNRQRIVNSRKFQIGYQVEDIGPSGIGGVELFITQDQGHKWWKYGDDPDQRSPFDVEVPQDGEYGFVIRARSGVGLAVDPPAPNDPPAIVVVVDQTPPELEMLPVRQGTGSLQNQLQLRWRMSDAHPDEKPVAIYYAANLDGPWETISPWKADTGEHIWTVGPNVPPQVYFRIVARDAAGNTSEAQTSRPVIVDLSRPSARIVDIEPTTLVGPQ